MPTYTSGSLALPIPEDDDPLQAWPQILRDMAAAIELQLGDGAAVSYAPDLQVLAGTDPNLGTVGNGSVEDGLYTVLNGWARVSIRLKFADTGAVNGGSGSWRITLPVQPADIVARNYFTVGTATIIDASVPDNYLRDAQIVGMADGSFGIGIAGGRETSGKQGPAGRQLLSDSNLITFDHSDEVFVNVSYPVEV